MPSELIIDLLVCPKTKRRLSRLNVEKSRMMDLIRTHSLTLEDGGPVSHDYDYLLVDDEKERAYQVVRGIPELLFEKSFSIKNISF